MSTELDARKINAIVGSAVRALVESGADDEAVGAFAASHRAKVAELLGVTEQLAPRAPDLLALVTQAVHQALEESGVKPRGNARKAPAARLYVEVKGVKTSISLNRALLDRLIASKGGEPAAAKAAVQELANAAPKDAENRSGWVAERIESILQLQRAELVPGARH